MPRLAQTDVYASPINCLRVQISAAIHVKQSQRVPNALGILLYSSSTAAGGEKELLEALNKQRRQGWEMVTAIERFGTTLIVFKRRSPKESGPKTKREN